MGLIKAAAGALGGALGDAWQDAIHCPTMDNQTVACHGVKMANPNDSRTSNTKGSANVITNKSWIIVEQNVCMLTIDNGKITGVVTEPGRYQFVNSSAPSVFAGEIGDAAKDVIQRFIYGGTPSYEQQVIYINLQRLPGIRFGTGTPVPYFDPRYNTTIELRFHGTFEIQIPDAENAVKFYSQVMAKGVNASDLTVNGLFNNEQYKTELLESITAGLAGLSAENVTYAAIQPKVKRLRELTSVELESIWGPRGIKLTSLAIPAVTPTEESKELLGDRLKADTLTNPDVQRAVMVGSVAKGIEAAGANENGAMMGFMGMNMAMGAGGNILGTMPPTQQPMGGMQGGMQQAPANGWTCSCGAVNTGAFCSNCGNKKPEAWTCSCGATNTTKFCANCGKSKAGAAPQAPAGWTCECGNVNTTKFCSNCGKPKPAAKKKYKCDKCGWTPADPAHPPKFCPECGDPFDDSDLV